MFSTGLTDDVRERNRSGGIAPQTGLVITSKDRFDSDSFTLRWSTGGELVDDYTVTLGTTQGGVDLYNSQAFRIDVLPEENDYNGQWTVSGVTEQVAWVRLYYRYGLNESRYVDQLVYFKVEEPVIIPSWNDSLLWDDDEVWTE